VIVNLILLACFPAGMVGFVAVALSVDRVRNVWIEAGNEALAAGVPLLVEPEPVPPVPSPVTVTPVVAVEPEEEVA
jgi:hypothetical protein